MAVLAKAFVAMAACFAVAFANNSTSSTVTTTTTLTIFTTSTPGGGTTSTLAGNATTDTTTVTTTTIVTTTNELQQKVEGNVGLTITGDCSAFCSSADVQLSWQKTMAAAAGSGVEYTMVDVTLTHTCTRRLGGLSTRKDSYSSGAARRLAGAVNVAYEINIPAGSTVAVNDVKDAITATSTSALSTSFASKLVAEGVSSSTYAVTVLSVSTPSVSAVTTTATATTTTTVGAVTTTATTTTMTLPAGVDSSAFLRKAFSSAHLWGLIALFAANHFFA